MKMRKCAPIDRFMRVAIAMIMVIAATLWANLSPLHADGPGVLRLVQATSARPCHHQAEPNANFIDVADQDACAALCATAASHHFIGDVIVPFALEGGKSPLTALATAMFVPARGTSDAYRSPRLRRSDGAPAYFLTRRLRI